MLFKRKYIGVVIFSCIIIAVVFISTLVGYGIYIQWKEDTLALEYKKSLFKITAELLEEDVTISNIHAQIPSSGIFANMPVLEGAIHNNSGKTINSVLVEVSFVKSDGTVIYRDSIYPLRESENEYRRYLADVKTTGMLLRQDGTVDFVHLMRNCPKEIVDYLAKKGSFARSGKDGSISLKYKIEGIHTI